MKWWPDTCCPGDMIRVSIGSIKHYGIFVSEDEIIQFGPPPVASRAIDDSHICVCTTTAEEFSCGNIIEKAVLDKQEQRKRLSPSKTVEVARSRLGETGYNLLHNNCEHFVYECVFGIKKSTQEDEARARWCNRPTTDVYIAPMPETVAEQHFLCKAREAEIRKTTNTKLKASRIFDWQVLLYAANRSFGLQENELAFRKSLNGKWECDRFRFSLAHTEGAVVVGISNGEIGVDVENVSAWKQKPYIGTGLMKKMGQRICASEKETVTDEQDLLRLWLLKESIFKCHGRRFVPSAIKTEEYDAETFTLSEYPDFLFAVSAKQMDSVRFFLYENGSARSINSKVIRNGKNK